jgi:integrase
MARKLRSPIDNRTARLAFPIRRKPHAFTTVAPGVGLGYRRNRTVGAWVVRCATGRGDYWTANLDGIPDDFEDADGAHVLDFYQACDRARDLARGKTDDSRRPATWATALDAYEADLRARGGAPGNASRVRGHLTPALLGKPVALLTPAELRRWRDHLLANGLTPGAVLRTIRAAKASLNLAANLDPRIVDRSAWATGLSGLSAPAAPISRVLSDADVLALVAEAYALNSAFGLLIDVLASTGTRASQARRLRIADLQADRLDPRLMMPSSRKGRRKESTRRPVPIPISLAVKLKSAASDRESGAPLLIRTDGTAWHPRGAEFWKLWRETARRAGIDCTAYTLRHSSIVRSLLAGTPMRVVAANHDTSTVMLERVYSAFISDHADTVARRGMLDTAQPAEANVVQLPARR